MKRLTKRSEEGEAFIVLDENSKEWSVSVDEPSYAHTIQCEAVDKLAEYEDLEEQGLLLRLPCKVGDTVYYIFDKKVKPAVVMRFSLTDEDLYITYKGVYSGVEVTLNSKKIGKQVFLTKEEAEQKLAGCKGE